MAKKGGRRKNAGRKKGVTRKLAEMSAQVIRLTGCTPAQFLDKTMHNKTLPIAIRLEAAKSLMPYVHKKQPEARELIAPPDQADPRLAVAALMGLIGL